MPARITPLQINHLAEGDLILQLPPDFDYHDEVAVAKVAAVLAGLETTELQSA